MNCNLTDNAIRVLRARYLMRDADGQIVETPEELFRRVARSVSQAEEKYEPGAARRCEEEFFQMLAALDFLPNSPTLMNAGLPLGQLSACFVLPVEDSLAEIFESLKLAALIQQSGGGTGFSFSHLRPKGDIVSSTFGAASGPVSFMRIFDTATENVRQGGRRRGANMGVLRVDHPDIAEFVEAKLDMQSFQNFNLSVAVTDEFMRAVESDDAFALRHPRKGIQHSSTSAKALFERIAEAAWQVGDPGLIFIDAVNRANPTPIIGQIEATNPCGEVPLLPYEACNLGSINLSHVLRREKQAASIDWEQLARIVRTAVRFLDNVIDVGRWPSPRIQQVVQANRKIGLGVMGFADLLIELDIPYGSDRAIALASELIKFISAQASTASQQLAEQRGEFPNWSRSIYAVQGKKMRNATLTSIAPTGTIGIIADTSAGIEPLFALAYRRQHVLGDQTLVELNPSFQRYAHQHGFYSERLEQELFKRGTLAGIQNVPASAARLFRTALEIAPAEHLRIQAAFQQHVDNAVSKTVNLPHDATAEDVANVYRQAWQLGLKGVTIYRYGSREQVLALGAAETPEERENFARCDPHDCKV